MSTNTDEYIWTSKQDEMLQHCIIVFQTFLKSVVWLKEGGWLGFYNQLVSFDTLLSCFSRLKTIENHNSGGIKTALKFDTEICAYKT